MRDNKFLYKFKNSDEQSRPHLPNHGYGFNEEYEGKHHGHHHGKHHHHCHKHHHGHHRNGTSFSGKMHSAKCWYKSLSWKSKVLLFSVGFFGLLTAVICCGLCSKRRQARKVRLFLPLSPSVVCIFLTFYCQFFWF